MNTDVLNYIQNHIDYQFENPDLLLQAFTRRSYSQEHGGADNEVLEFIGDKALDFVVVKYLSDTYGSYAHEGDRYKKESGVFLTEYNEGELSEMKALLVQKRMLSHRIDLLGFAQFLRMGKGDFENEVDKKESVKEDLFEAIIGAVALDSKWDMNKLKVVVDNMLSPDVELDNDDGYDNYVGRVQDWSVEMAGRLPLYHIAPYSDIHYYMGSYIYGNNSRVTGLHRKFMCYLELPDRDEVFLDFGETEKAARHGAAQAAYVFLKEKNLLPTIRDEIENPNYEDSIGQLEILARRGYFQLPTYKFVESHNGDGNPIWDCDCVIKDQDKTTHGSSSSKKDAKKQAAFEMLQYVLET